MWQKKVKKAVFLLNIDNYAPNITKLTYPLMRIFAEKIGAELVTITERKFPDFAPVYEKLQIYELAQKMENDWNIYIDSDAIVNPDMPDPTVLLSKDTVMHNGMDFAPIRWREDRFFARDGRHLGSCNWFTVGSDQCIELWKPLDDLTQAQALERIFPTQMELQNGITPPHLIDDFTLSRNIAKYGLKATTYTDLLKNKFGDPGDFMWHQYLIPNDVKYKYICKRLKDIGLLKFYPHEVQEEIKSVSKQLEEEIARSGQ